jgi:Ni,Fe-hydrogenase III small subunit/formate hydrogenlyase subunit 6/NADH:ubiquinone oxidoreductase subunit I
VSLFKSLRVLRSQGTQYIKDLRGAEPAGFRGLPFIAAGACAESCAVCRDVCPTAAISVDAVRLNLGRCVFCNACAEACPEKKIAFTTSPKMGATDPARLVVGEAQAALPATRPSADLSTIFGRSLKLRQVSAGGCNGCELELNALANVNFDVQRFGIEWVASPRHADGLVITGPLTRNMADAVRLAWEAIPEPRFLVAVGACAISGGLYDGAPGVERTFLSDVGPTLYVPGCPPHPLTFVNAILDLLRAR